MSIKLGKSTNKGTAMMKFAHQFQPDVILEDKYVGWFIDNTAAQSLKENALNIGMEPIDDAQRFQQVAYWYTILREKYGDEVIATAIESGCKQLVLLGSGYDTRFFRIPLIRAHAVSTFEIDLPKTIDDKQKILIEKLGHIPQRLSLIPFDLIHDDLSNLSRYGFDKTLATAFVWQGVSYYLPKESVSRVLDFIQSHMAHDSVLYFDCCSPLMTFNNDRVPGVAANIDKLAEIGEPYLFGMVSDDMEAWLEEKGFQGIEILQQDDLEEKFLHTRTIPNNMWYVVVTKAC